MLRIGLTGSIAAGKSTVLGIFAERGVPVFSSDEIVHELYHGEAVPLVEALFPGVSHKGEIDRSELSRRLVGHPEALARLESTVHPLVRKRLARFFADAEASGAPLAVADIPLLYETGFDDGLDRIVVVSVDAAQQRRRALARPGMDVEKLAAILARQMPQSEKVKRADAVIDTSKSLSETRATIGHLIDRLREEAK